MNVEQEVQQLKLQVTILDTKLSTAEHQIRNLVGALIGVGIVSGVAFIRAFVG